MLYPNMEFDPATAHANLRVYELREDMQRLTDLITLAHRQGNYARVHELTQQVFYIQQRLSDASTYAAC